MRGERGGGRLGRETDAHLRVTGRARVVGEERQRLRHRLAGQEKLDDRPVDLAPASRRQRVCRELADLLVGEAVVRRRGLGLLHEQPGRGGGRHQVTERDQIVLLPTLPDPDRATPAGPSS